MTHPTTSHPAPLFFYFDFISPYAFLAWTQIHALAAAHGREVRPVPILFAALLNRWGHLGPAEIPPKREYVFKNVLRLAHGLGVSLSPPPNHPFNPLLALRVVSVPRPPADQKRLIDLLFEATWGSGVGDGLWGVEDAQTIAKIVAAAQLDPAAALSEALSDDNKARVRAQTDDALKQGVFGVPTVIADGELFWGLDAFPHLDAFLRGQDPVNPDLITRWRDLPASARRTPTGQP